MSGGAAASDWRADVSLAVVTLIWGATFVMVKNALENVSTLLFLTLRFSLAAVLLWLAFRGKLGGRDARLAWKAGILAGICLFTGYSLQTFGLRLTSPSKSAFLTGMCTVLVPMVAAVAYRRLPGWPEALGVAVSGVGMGMLTLERFDWRIGQGELLTLGCALLYAVHILVLGHYSRRVPFEQLSVIQIGTSAALGGMTFFWWEPWFIRWTPDVIWALLITGVLATAVAFSVQSWAQRHTTPTRTGLIFALEPVFAWLTSYLLTGETLAARPAAGAGLILTGIVMVELRPFQRKRPGHEI